MLKKTITYRDYNDVERTEDCYFNLSESELLEMEKSVTGGYSEMVHKIIDAKDEPTLIKLFKELLLKSYGQKSADGRRFIKSDELSLAFSQTEAFNKIYMELATDDVAAADFVNGLIPSKVRNQVLAQSAVDMNASSVSS